MTRPNDQNGEGAAKWWNEKSNEELEQLEYLQKEMMAAMRKMKMGPDDTDEDEDMGPPDLPEDDEEMSPPDLSEDDEDMALEPTDREMDMQSRMGARRAGASRRPRMRRNAERMMKSGAPRETMTKALRAELELKRAFSSEKRRELADEGMALPDGSFPIVTTGDLENAIMAFGRAKSKSAAKRHIIKRARALKRTDLIPEKWGVKDAKGMGMPQHMMPDGTMMDGATHPKKKKKLRYGEKEMDTAEMEDDEMTSPMSREELMERIFKKKKKGYSGMPVEEGMDEEL